MKNVSILFLAGLIALSMVACGGQPEPTPVEQPLPISEEEKTQEEIMADDANAGPLMVADAALYRGTVTAMEETDDGLLLTLAQAEGTDFGAPNKEFLLNGDTKLSFEESRIAPGVYLEVYYGGAADAAETTDIIAANFFDAAEMVNFNGILEEVTINPDREGQGRLVMTQLNTNETVEFNYDRNGNTQFYKDFDQLKPGDKLNIFHKGIYTMSLPPQGIALEVQDYQDPAALEAVVKTNPNIGDAQQAASGQVEKEDSDSTKVSPPTNEIPPEGSPENPIAEEPIG